MINISYPIRGKLMPNPSAIKRTALSLRPGLLQHEQCFSPQWRQRETAVQVAGRMQACLPIANSRLPDYEVYLTTKTTCDANLGTHASKARAQQRRIINHPYQSTLRFARLRGASTFQPHGAQAEPTPSFILFSSLQHVEPPMSPCQVFSPRISSSRSFFASQPDMTRSETTIYLQKKSSST